MDWRTKSVIQRAIGAMPASHRCNHVLQRYVTRTLPPSEARLAETAMAARWVWDAARTHVGEGAGAQHWVEFGAGWHLGGALVLHRLGVGEQTLFDLHPVARPALVRRAMDHFGVEPPAAAPDAHRPTAAALVAGLGIDLRAPADVRRTGLPDASVHVVHSTSVLEHVPVDSLREMLAEFRRILRPEGVCAFLVDHHDHWAAADARIDGLNFLRYSERKWARWNCDLQFQNRLRHDDYVALFDAVGFALVHEEAIVDERLPADAALDPAFAGRRDLQVGDSRFVLRAR